MKATVTLCMIVKNEEKTLSRCLDSVSGIVDEIIIVDTGSTDGTKEIANGYTNKVFDFKWDNNFSEARNFGASFATGDWILVLDADEYVERENLVESLKEIKNDKNAVEIYAVNIINFSGEYGENVSQHRHSRLYKNNKLIQYHRTIHEQLKYIDDSQVKPGLSSLTIYHSGYLKQTIREKDKSKRNKILVEQELTDKTSESFDLFNIGNEYRVVGKYEEALDCYINAYKKKSGFFQDWIPFCLCNIIECLIILKRYDDALNVIKDAEKIYNQTADFTYLKGDIYLAQGRVEDAIEVFKFINENSNKLKGLIKSSDYRDYLPNKKLGIIYESKGEYEKSVNYYINAINNNNYCFESITNCINLFSIFHDEEEVFSFLEDRIFNHDYDLSFLKKIFGYLLNNSYFIIAQKLQNKYFGENESFKELLQLKFDIKNGNLINNIETNLLLYGMHNEIIDFADLLLIIINNNKLNQNENIQAIVGNSNINSIYKLITSQHVNIELVDIKLLLLFVEKCIKFQKLDIVKSLIDIILNSKTSFNSEIYEDLGNLLYKYNLIDESIKLYKMSKEIDILDVEAINNIIEYYVSIKQYNEALSFVFYAFDQNKLDFKVIKNGIIILDKLEEYKDKEKLIMIGLEIYPNSKWLREQ